MFSEVSIIKKFERMVNTGEVVCIQCGEPLVTISKGLPVETVEEAIELLREHVDMLYDFPEKCSKCGMSTDLHVNFFCGGIFGILGALFEREDFYKVPKSELKRIQSLLAVFLKIYPEVKQMKNEMKYLTDMGFVVE